MSNEPNKIIYSMIRVSKFYDKKPVLKDISLSYFYGAKIGVLGLNGSGKSSLLRIWPVWTRSSTVKPSLPGIYRWISGAGTPAGCGQDRSGDGGRRGSGDRRSAQRI